VLLTLPVCLAAATEARATIAVVVNPDNPVTEISVSELKRMYLGKRTVFADGAAIVLGAVETLEGPFYEAALGMTAFKVRRHWVKAVFAGSAGTPPEMLKDCAAALAFVSGRRNGIAFLDATAVDDSVKVIRLDGKLPGEEGYPLDEVR